ncbi:MAG: regulatory protein RecX [Fusicatenibacter sp.]|nr:regulatory protein RecX [Lachnospiraceae bacterium]MDY2937703.1 regulatory protein RecX [Fusicatenibacter sp.]
MYVTSVQSYCKTKSRVVLENGETLTLYNRELTEYGICEGEELSWNVYQEILCEVLAKRAKHRVLYLLMRQPKTRKQLLDKLKEDGYPDQIAADAVAYAESFHYVDDRNYAEQYLAGPGARKGRKAVIYELSEKGIDRQLIQSVLEETEGRDEASILRKEAFRRLGAPHKLEEKEYRRVFGYLARKGFESGAICRVLEEYRNLSADNDSTDE